MTIFRGAGDSMRKSMGKKTIGIIGKGNLIQHFFEHLTKQEKKDEFLSQVDRILFYNYGYQSAEGYEQSSGFKHIKQSLEELVKVGSFQRKPSSSGMQLGSVSDFDSLCSYADIIVDVSEGYRPGYLPDGSEREKSLLGYAHGIFVNKPSDKKMLNWENDYNCYIKEQQEKSADKCRIIWSKDEFKQHWDTSFELIQIISSVHQNYPLGMRMLDRFPFSAMMMKRRGQLFQQYIQKNPRRIVLPTYINFVNEPCMTSLILATHCPEIAPYLVASTGYDRDRLETMLNDNHNIIAAKERAGFSDFTIRINSISGIHDTHLMVPVPAAHNKNDQEKIAAIFGNFDFDSLTIFMKEAMGQYWSDYNPKTGKVDQRDINKELDASLFATITAALQSRGKPLSLFPDEEKTLGNGYFRALSADGKEGLFLTGTHRFRNGKIFDVPLQISVKEVKNFVTREEARVVNRLREVYAALPEIYSSEIDLLSPSASSSISASSPSSVSTSNLALELLCFLSVDKIVNKLQQVDDQWILHSLSLPKHKYKSIGVFQVEGQLYLAAGHSQGIEIINLQNDEKKSIFLQPLFNSNNCVQNIHCMEQHPGLGILVASHSSAGLLYLPLEQLLEQPHLSVKAVQSDLIKKENSAEPLNSKVHQGQIYLSKGHQVYRLQEQELVAIFSVPSVITALDVDAQGNIIVGTFGENIYYNDQPFYQSSHQDSSAHVAQLQACSYQSTKGVLFRSARANLQSGMVQFTAGGETIEIFNQGAINPLVGFAYSELDLFCAQEHKLFIQDIQNQEKGHQIIPVTGKIRCLHIYGG